MSEWQDLRIGQHVTIIPGFPFDSNRFDTEEGTPLVRIRDLFAGQTETKYRGHYDSLYLIGHGDVLVGMDGDFNIARWSGSIALLNQRMLKIANKPHGKLDCSFLYYVLGPLLTDINNRTSATTVKHLSTYDVSNAVIKAPSLPEQRKIARILTTLDYLIEKTESLIAKYQAIKQGMMHDLFTRGVDDQGQLRPPQAEAPDLYKQSELGWIPKEWDVRRLEQLYGTPIRDFGSFSSTNLITFLESGIPFIKSEMIEAGNINWEGVTYISDQVHRLLNKSHVRKGDILFTKIGSALGKGVVYDGSRGVCNSNAAVAKIDVDPRVAGRQFVTHFLNHDIAKVQLKNMIVSLLPRINLGDLNRLLVPTPGIDEQQRIEEQLLSSDATIKTEEACLRNFLSIKTGLMQDLLTGKVRAKVDEAEEVAAYV